MTEARTEGATEPNPVQQHRRLLFTVAYDLLGSAVDAEDVVQDAWLRWQADDRSDVTNPKAWLVTTTTRLALNKLRAAKTRRETYVGPWLPEPLLTAPDVADEVELADAVSMALLVLLETLSPVERGVFVLREVFGMPHEEVAEALGRSPAAVRQLAHRAREHVEARRPRYRPERGMQREVTARFRDACLSGDVAALMATMAPDVQLTTDGGGVAKAALRAITGPEKAARFLAAVTPDGAQGMTIEDIDLNGAPAIMARVGGRPAFAAQVHTNQDGRVDQILAFLNPEKLAGLASPAGLSLS